MNRKFNIKQTLDKLIQEVIEEKKSESSKSWADMMESLSKSIGKPISVDDKGNYNVCECQPHHISIRPVANDIFDLQYFKDGSDRRKKLYVKFDEVKKIVKEWLTSEDLNYVDSAYKKNVDNSKDKEGGKKADKVSEENVVDPEKDNKPAKEIKVKSMNDEKDDPTQPMREIEKIKKQIDHKSPKPSYKPPTLPKNLQKLVIKYTKKGKRKK